LAVYDVKYRALIGGVPDHPLIKGQSAVLSNLGIASVLTKQYQLRSASVITTPYTWYTWFRATPHDMMYQWARHCTHGLGALPMRVRNVSIIMALYTGPLPQ